MILEIANAEYEQRRHASDLAAWINGKLWDMDTRGQREEQYFERRGMNMKRLIEEAVPLSRLGLSLWKPGDEPFITLLPKADNVDAEVEIRGGSAILNRSDSWIGGLHGRSFVPRFRSPSYVPSSPS